MQRLRRQLTYANVAATLALILALGGSTYAVAGDKVNGGQIVNRAISGKKLAGVRVDSASTGSGPSTLNCRSGERMLSGGVSADPVPGSPSPFTPVFGESHPTLDGNGWVASAGPNKTVYILCLKAKPGG